MIVDSGYLLMWDVKSQKFLGLRMVRREMLVTPNQGVDLLIHILIKGPYGHIPTCFQGKKQSLAGVGDQYRSKITRLKSTEI